MQKSTILFLLCLTLCSSSAVFSMRNPDFLDVRVIYHNGILSPGDKQENFNHAKFSLKITDGLRDEILGDFLFTLENNKHTAETQVSYSPLLNRQRSWRILLYPEAEKGQASALSCWYTDGTSISMQQLNRTAEINPQHVGESSLLTITVGAFENPDKLEDFNVEHTATINERLP